MVALLSRSAARRALNAARGRSHRSRAIPSSSAVSGSAGRAAPGSARTASSACASRSIWARSVMGVPHAGAQALQRAELQLLDGAFRAAERPRDLGDAPLLDEALHDDAPLVQRQSAHQIGERGAAVDLVVARVADGRGHRLPALARRALPAVGLDVPGDLQQPGDERDPAPLEAAQPGARPGADVTSSASARLRARRTAKAYTRSKWRSYSAPKRRGSSRAASIWDRSSPPSDDIAVAGAPDIIASQAISPRPAKGHARLAEGR